MNNNKKQNLQGIKTNTHDTVLTGNQSQIILLNNTIKLEANE